MPYKLPLQPCRCSLPSLPILKVNLLTRISLSLFVVFYSRKERKASVFLSDRGFNLIIKTTLHTMSQVIQKSFSNRSILCIYQSAQLTKSTDCGDPGPQSNRASGLLEEGCLIPFVTSNLPTYWSWHISKVNAHFHSNLSKVRPYSFCLKKGFHETEMDERGTAQSIKTDSLQHTSQETLLWTLQFN